MAYRIAQGSTQGLPDVEEFLESLNAPGGHPAPEARALFASEAELFVARAPGRLDVMGGIADYSGSLVLQLPLREAAVVALERDRSRRLRVLSLKMEQSARTSLFEMALADFERDGGPIDYEAARALFQKDASQHWAAYVAGAFLVLMRERGVRFREGARLLIASRVPEGKGVSSSAAIEVAAMRAIVAAFGLELEPRELALLCQKVENLVVGAPCGIMDQMTSACGEDGSLLALLCQPAELRGTIPLPRGAGLWGIDSGVRHSVSGADYGSVRVGAFMGQRMLAEMASRALPDAPSFPSAPAFPGAPGEVGPSVEGTARPNGEKWMGGYLANLTPSEFEQFYAGSLPRSMRGDQFLAHYEGTHDTVTRVEPGREYPVRAPTSHPIYEHFRVRAFAELLSGGAVDEERRLGLLGELMYQSHASYSACGLGSEGTDLLVQYVREAGPARGLYGAKITGGGSGGTVAVLGRADAGPAIASIVERYARATGRTPQIFQGSSPGAARFGHLKLEPSQT